MKIKTACILIAAICILPAVSFAETVSWKISNLTDTSVQVEASGIPDNAGFYIDLRDLTEGTTWAGGNGDNFSSGGNIDFLKCCSVPVINHTAVKVFTLKPVHFYSLSPFAATKVGQVGEDPEVIPKNLSFNTGCPPLAPDELHLEDLTVNSSNPDSCKDAIHPGTAGSSNQANQSNGSSSATSLNNTSPVEATISAGNLSFGLNIENPTNVNNIQELIEKILNIVIMIGIPIIVLAIIYCGFLFVKAEGDPSALKTAKETLLWTIIGAAIILASWILAKAICETITQLGTTTTQCR